MVERATTSDTCLTREIYSKNYKWQFGKEVYTTQGIPFLFPREFYVNNWPGKNESRLVP